MKLTVYIIGRRDKVLHYYTYFKQLGEMYRTMDLANQFSSLSFELDRTILYVHVHVHENGKRWQASALVKDDQRP